MVDGQMSWLEDTSLVAKAGSHLTETLTARPRGALEWWEVGWGDS